MTDEGKGIFKLSSMRMEQNCKFKFNWNPFDRQTCAVAVGSNMCKDTLVNFTGKYVGFLRKGKNGAQKIILCLCELPNVFITRYFM